MVETWGNTGLVKDESELTSSYLGTKVCSLVVVTPVRDNASDSSCHSIWLEWLSFGHVYRE